MNWRDAILIAAAGFMAWRLGAFLYREWQMQKIGARAEKYGIE